MKKYYEIHTWEKCTRLSVWQKNSRILCDTEYYKIIIRVHKLWLTSLERYNISIRAT